MSNQPLHISIVDDDDAIRDMQLRLLSSLGSPMQTFSSGCAFVESAELMAPGCVVLDLAMESDMAGVEVFNKLLACKSPKVVLFLSAYGTIPNALAQVKRGAFDWLVKPVDGTELKQRVRSALLLAERRRAAKEIWELLTAREKEVMRYVALGLASKEVARVMVPAVDSRTVDTFRAAGRDKTGIHNQADMRAWMIENAWLTDFAEAPVVTS